MQIRRAFDIYTDYYNLLFSVTFKLYFCRKTKVTYLHFHIFGQKHVSEFQISMDDTAVVEVPQSIDNLKDKVPHFRFRETSP